MQEIHVISIWEKRPTVNADKIVKKKEKQFSCNNLAISIDIAAEYPILGSIINGTSVENQVEKTTTPMIWSHFHKQTFRTNKNI